MAAGCFSPEIWKSWERTGKLDFLKTCKQLVDNENDTSPLFGKSKKKDITRAIYELIWHGIKGPLRRESTSNALGELALLHNDLPALIVDVISVVDCETTAIELKLDERERFCYIVKEAEKFLSDKLIKERLEIDSLQDVGALKNKTNFYTKFIKVKTKLFYKQQKFNLFRGESEGYAKLIAELNQEFMGSISTQYILEVIKSLIGCFNLDPNRVLDIILESFESRPDQGTFFIAILQSYMCDPKILSEVLGFKFRFYQPGAIGGTVGDLETTPESLYLVTALMIQHNIINLKDVYEWLAPDDKIMQKESDKEMKDAKEFLRKVNIISTKEKEKEDEKEEKENQEDKYLLNQKFGLCEALLKIGDWQHAQELIKCLPDNFANLTASDCKTDVPVAPQSHSTCVQQVCSISEM